MFSSLTNTASIMTSFNMSPFPHYYLPSSSSPNHLLQPQLQEHDTFLHQIHQLYDPTFLPPNPPTLPDSLANFEIRAAPIAPKKAAKKDRHSKIHTAQGLRDRRVRLSIEIARQFFDLHDVLGFDKASKTLEWLLKKSRKAIEELSSMGSKSLGSCPDSECDQAGSEVNEEIELPVLPTDRGKDDQLAASDSNNVSDEALLTSHLAVKESRAKARARARERTKEKRFKWKNVIEKPQISTKFGSWKNVVNIDDHHNVVIVNKSNYLKYPYDDPNNNNNKAIYSPSSSSILPPNWNKNCTALSASPIFGLST